MGRGQDGEGGGACRVGVCTHLPGLVLQGELGAGGAQVVCSGVSNISMRSSHNVVSSMSLKKKEVLQALQADRT